VGDFGINLLAHFGITGVKAVKERGYYLCDTANGFVKIHRTSDEPMEIYTRHDLLKKLENAGFLNGELILETPQGIPYVNLGRDMFIMCRHIPGRDLDLDNPNDIALALETLARFHQAACNISVGYEPSPLLTEVYAKQSAALNHAVKQVNRRPRLSDFDILLIKYANLYGDYAADAQSALAKTDYAALHSQALSQGRVCHNALKEENLPIYKDSCYLLNLSDATIDLQLTDLSNFIRRYARRSSRSIPIQRLIELYSKFNPLPDSARAIIHAQLSYPWPFMKIVSQYYSKKRNFTPVAITSRMTEVLEEQAAYDGYVNTLQ